MATANSGLKPPRYEPGYEEEEIVMGSMDVELNDNDGFELQ